MPITKRVFVFTAVLLVFFLSAGLSKAEELRLTVPSAILFDMTTGRVLYTHNADAPIQPASITKVLTLYIASEAIREGNVSPDDSVKISRTAGRTNGSTMHIKVGSEIPLKELKKRYVYDATPGVSEAMSTDLTGHTPYGVSKLVGDLYVQEYSHIYKMRTAVFRMSCLSEKAEVATPQGAINIREINRKKAQVYCLGHRCTFYISAFA